MRPPLFLAAVAASAAIAASAAWAQVGDTPFAAGAPDIVTRQEDAASIAAGQKVVVGSGAAQTSSACFRCHGMNGAGDPAAVFPRLADQSGWYLYRALKAYASGERENRIMTPIAKELTDAEMRNVAAYYAAQHAPYPPRPRVDPLLLQQGGQLSAIGSAAIGVQACVNCHGPAGIGLPPEYPFLAGQYADYLALQLRAWKTGARQPDPDAIMANIARQLSEQQIDAVAAYFASVRPGRLTPEPGAPGPGLPAPAAGIIAPRIAAPGGGR